MTKSLVLLYGDKEWALEPGRTLTIGRARGNDVVVMATRELLDCGLGVKTGAADTNEGG